jgi:hypothetical protein
MDFGSFSDQNFDKFFAVSNYFLNEHILDREMAMSQSLFCKNVIIQQKKAFFVMRYEI